MNKIFKILASITLISVMMMIMPISMIDVSANAISGECGISGNHVTWELENGTLTITGTGYMNNYYTTTTPVPWDLNKLDITSVIINNGVESIGARAFQGCTNLGTITIADSVSQIGSYAFKDCTNLDGVTIPSDVKTIQDCAFQSCTSLKEITIPNSVENMSTSVFLGCTALESVTLSDSLETIAEGMFTNCEELKSIIIPSSVTSIEPSAFGGCTNLSSITIPSSVKTIGASVFDYCPNLKTLYTEKDSIIEAYVKNYYQSINVVYCDTLHTPDSTCSICGEYTKPLETNPDPIPAPTPTPYIPAPNSWTPSTDTTTQKVTSLSDGKLADILSNAKAGSTVTVKAEPAIDGVELPSDILKAIKGKDVTLKVKLTNGAIVSVNGKDIKSADDTNINLEYNTKNIPSKLIKKAKERLGKNASAVQLSLGDEGKLGFTATASVKFNAKYAGKEIKIYRYDSEENKLVFVGKTTISKDGRAEFDTSFGGDFVAVFEK